MLLPKSKLWRLFASVAVLALAVGAYIRFVRAPALDPAQAVPAYAAVSSTLTLHANDPFEILARPASPPPKVVAYAFAIGERDPDPIEATTELLPDGTIRIRGVARARHASGVPPLRRRARAREVERERRVDPRALVLDRATLSYLPVAVQRRMQLKSPLQWHLSDALGTVFATPVPETPLL